MTDAKVVIRAAARRDLETHYRWLLTEADRDVADRFATAVDATFSKLLGQPGMGAAIDSHHPRLVDIRKWKVDGFPNVLIFYQPRPAGISVVRVIHAAQDWWGVIEKR